MSAAKPQPHIHHPGDGRGARDVVLDGKPLKRVIYADTDLGIVRFHDDPPQIDKQKEEWIVRTLKGKVEVVIRKESD